MSESDEKDDPCEMTDPCPVQPAKRFFVELHYSGMQRVWRQMNGRTEDSDGAPDDQNHNHHGGHDHDLQGLLARFMHALNVLPPEIHHDQNSEDCGKVVLGKDQGMV